MAKAIWIVYALLRGPHLRKRRAEELKEVEFELMYYETLLERYAVSEGMRSRVMDLYGEAVERKRRL